MIKGVVFDFDGLILDTEIPAFQSWQLIFARHGCELTLTSWADYIGRSPDSFDPCDMLETCLGRPVDHDRLHQEEMEHETRLIAMESALPGVDALIDEVRVLGLRLGIASSSSRDWVIGHLQRLGLVDRFDCIVCADDVLHTKPAPDLYVAAVNALGITSAAAVALEDSPHGVTAAKAAGLFCIAVPNALTRHLSFDRADLTLKSLHGVAFQELLSRLERRQTMPQLRGRGITSYDQSDKLA